MYQFDFVHLIKNVRNNWVTESCQELDWEKGKKKTAKWANIKAMHSLKANQIVKFRSSHPKCSENMQQIYRGIPMPKCDSNKVASYNCAML